MLARTLIAIGIIAGVAPVIAASGECAAAGGMTATNTEQDNHASGPAFSQDSTQASNPGKRPVEPKDTVDTNSPRDGTATATDDGDKGPVDTKKTAGPE